MARPMSDAQFRVLDNLARGEDPFVHISGLAAHGGASSTRAALWRKGWINSDIELTNEGREAHAAEKLRREPWIPMCWKCTNRITESRMAGDTEVMTLVGCKGKRSIKNYADAKKRCPIKPENRNVEPRNTSRH